MPSSDLLPGASNGAANAVLFERVPGVDERTDTVRVAVSGSVLRLGGAGLTEPTVNGATGNGATGNGAAANGAAANGAAADGAAGWPVGDTVAVLLGVDVDLLGGAVTVPECWGGGVMTGVVVLRGSRYTVLAAAFAA
jgi:hypothetical protein